MQQLNRRNLFSGAVATVLCGTFSSASIAQSNRPASRVSAVPDLPRLVKVSSDIVVTIGFELSPTSGLWGSIVPDDATLESKYLDAGTITSAGIDNSLLSVSLRELRPKIRSGQRFSQSFSPEVSAGLSLFWFNAVTESAMLPVGSIPTLVSYALSFFIQISAAGSTTEYKYPPPALEKGIGIAKAAVSDMIGLFRTA